MRFDSLCGSFEKKKDDGKRWGARQTYQGLFCGTFLLSNSTKFTNSAGVSDPDPHYNDRYQIDRRRKKKKKYTTGF